MVESLLNLLLRDLEWDWGSRLYFQQPKQEAKLVTTECSVWNKMISTQIGEMPPPCYLWIPIHILMWFAFCCYLPEGFQNVFWNDLPKGGAVQQASWSIERFIIIWTRCMIGSCTIFFIYFPNQLSWGMGLNDDATRDTECLFRPPLQAVP